MNKIRKKVRAISPVLAILLMIVITVAASLVTYAWVMGYLSFTTAKAGRAIQVQSVAYNETTQELWVYVQNVGEGFVTLRNDSSVYVGGILMLGADVVISGTTEGALHEGDTAPIVVQGVSIPPGQRVRVKVVDESGTFTEINTVPLTGTAPSGPPPFAYLRKSITFDHTEVVGASPLTDFPVLISISGDSDLQTDTHPQGWDIHFTNEGGTIQLSHEIEHFDQASGDLVAWVKIPSLSDTVDTVTYMLYGDPAATASEENVADVWSNGYAGVWHLKESGSGIAGEYKDSTIHNNDGQGGAGTANRVPAQVAGRIGYAQDFEGTDSTPDFIIVGSGSALSITGSITLEAWVWVESWEYEYWHMIVARQYGTSSGDGYLLCLNDGGTAYIIVGSNNANSGGVATGAWYHVVGVASGSTRRVYLNAVGGSVGGGVTWSLDSNPVLIGAGENGVPGTFPDEQLDGKIDEVRISNTVRSSGWIQTEYNNQNSPGTFFTLGTEE
jgi:FlaG/FlaF family flagellin (archaellin)